MFCTGLRRCSKSFAGTPSPFAIAAEIHPASGSQANFRHPAHHLPQAITAGFQWATPPPSRQTSPASCNSSGTALRHRGARRRGKCSRWTLFGSIGNTAWPSIAVRRLLVFPMNCRKRHSSPWHKRQSRQFASRKPQQVKGKHETAAASPPQVPRGRLFPNPTPSERHCGRRRNGGNDG